MTALRWRRGRCGAWVWWVSALGELDLLVKTKPHCYAWAVSREGKPLTEGFSLNGQRSAKRRATLAAQRLLL